MVSARSRMQETNNPKTASIKPGRKGDKANARGIVGLDL